MSVLPGRADTGRGRPAGHVGRRVVTRRAALVAGVVVAAGGAGAVAGELRAPADRPADPRTAAPDWLTAALTRERTLLTLVGTASASKAPTAALLEVIRTDHDAHLRALEDIASQFRPDRSPAESTARSSGAPATRSAAPAGVGLRRAEARAAAEGARAAVGLPGADAAVIASIAACEAAHAELLR